MPKISEVSRTADVDAPAAFVWRKLCEPCSILQWNSRIATCRSKTDERGRIVRHYTLASEDDAPPTMVETELDRSDAIMAITYAVEIQGLPISNYVAQITVTPKTAESAVVEIRSRFVDVAYPNFDASVLVGVFYDTGLGGLAELMRDIQAADEAV